MIPKFRAWDKEHNEMVYPDDVDKIYFEITVDGIVTYDMRHTLPDDNTPNYLDTIIMQSTGLTDKNGKEIFEGDVVNIQFVVWDFEGEIEKEYKNAAIYFDTYGSQLTVPSFYIKDEYGVRLLSELAFYDENIEVIGNIHEHPELLGEQT